MGILNAVMEAVGIKSYLDMHRILALDEHEERYLADLDHLSEKDRELVNRLINAKRKNKKYMVGKLLRKLTRNMELEMDLLKEVTNLESLRGSIQWRSTGTR